MLSLAFVIVLNSLRGQAFHAVGFIGEVVDPEGGGGGVLGGFGSLRL